MFNADRRHKIAKQMYPSTSWSAYNESLCQPGDLSMWVSDEVIWLWSASRGACINIRIWRLRLLDLARRQRPTTAPDARSDAQCCDADCGLGTAVALMTWTPHQNKWAPLGVYNIVHPQQWSLDEVIAAVAKVNGPFSVSYDHADNTGFAGFPLVRPVGSSVVAAEAELGFTARHDLLDSFSYWWAA